MKLATLKHSFPALAAVGAMLAVAGPAGAVKMETRFGWSERRGGPGWRARRPSCVIDRYAAPAA